MQLQILPRHSTMYVLSTISQTQFITYCFNKHRIITAHTLYFSNHWNYWTRQALLTTIPLSSTKFSLIYFSFLSSLDFRCSVYFFTGAICVLFGWSGYDWLQYEYCICSCSCYPFHLQYCLPINFFQIRTQQCNSHILCRIECLKFLNRFHTSLNHDIL